MTLWNLNPFSSRLRWRGPLPLTMWHLHACTNIPQATKDEEEEEEEGDTPQHVDAWRNARVWIDFFLMVSINDKNP